MSDINFPKNPVDGQLYVYENVPYFWNESEQIWFSNGGDGPVGPPGGIGPPGPPGKDGDKGDPFTYDDFTGAQLDALTGPQGEQGEDGEQGDPFLYSDFTPQQLANLKGEKGEKGDRGLTGDDGDQGDPFTYDDFTQDQLDDLTGPPGKQGDDGNDGDPFTYDMFTQDQLDDLKGEKGDKGDKGDDGEQGTGIQIVGTLDSGEEPNNVKPKYDSLLEPAGNALIDPDDGFLWVSDGTDWVNIGSIQGPPGKDGDKGDDFTYDDFTQAQLDALKGEKGDDGDDFTYDDFTQDQLDALKGDPGEDGKDFTYDDFTPTQLDGLKGEKGDKGDPFIYDDFTPTQLETLKGEKGDDGDDGKDFTYDDFTNEQLESLKGEKGDDFTYDDFTEEQLEGLTGPQGEKGDDFTYDDFTEDQLNDLQGPQGQPGADGKPGNDAVTTLNVDEFIGDGKTKEFTLTAVPETKNNAQIYISGVYQEKSSFIINGLDLTLSEAPPDGETVEVVVAYVNPSVDGGLKGGGSLFKGNNGTVGDASGINDIFRVNAQTLTTNVTIDTDQNASAAGPLAIADAVVLAVRGNLTVV